MAEEAKAKEPKKKMPRKKKLTIWGIVLVVIIAGGAGFWVWHETPGFCAAFCHNMDQYLDGYNQEQGVAGVDKYGNAVSNTNAMMAVLHREAGESKTEIRCMGCHHPVIGEQVTEGVEWISGNYEDPLTERVGGDLTKWWKEPANNFCSNSKCHADLLGSDGALDYMKLAKATAGSEFNPHVFSYHGISLECTDCHKGHRASTVVCTGCHHHEDVTLPDGWVAYHDSEDLLKAAFN